MYEFWSILVHDMKMSIPEMIQQAKRQKLDLKLLMQREKARNAALNEYDDYTKVFKRGLPLAMPTQQLKLF